MVSDLTGLLGVGGMDLMKSGLLLAPERSIVTQHRTQFLVLLNAFLTEIVLQMHSAPQREYRINNNKYRNVSSKTNGTKDRM